MNNNSNISWNNDVLNMMNAMSFVLGIMNLELNNKQLSNDELDKHLKEQDNILKDQNETYLKRIIEQNEKIISLLERRTNEN